MEKPWYKQFWPWFLIILPLIVVSWTIVTVIIFSNNSVSLVTEDYYKKGKGINIDISKLNVAKQLELEINIESKAKLVNFTLNKGQLAHYPALNILFAHRTLPNRDFSKLVTSDANGNYSVALDHDLKGPWFIEVTPHDKAWLIQGRVNFPVTQPTMLMN
ncbi:FixH family protein [Vibrio sp. S4M6]|uniref:FixH family protein n=1 Tax=Vibrio sinus TaxID=2946865 RepID=UPI00202A32E8|nr:FixH family protein [Vibrio sinus]MCL9783276.1 FixH family protein [Vibrio sinus]